MLILLWRLSRGRGKKMVLAVNGSPGGIEEKRRWSNGGVAGMMVTITVLVQITVGRWFMVVKTVAGRGR
jgi:hypothetical protein